MAKAHDLSRPTTIPIYDNIEEALKDYPFNPDTDRALAYTNAETIKVNERIAKHLGLPAKISIGEKVSINGLIGELVGITKLDLHTKDLLTIYPKCISKGQLMSGDKLISTIEKIEEDIAKYSQQLPDAEKFYIEIEGTTYGFNGDINHYVNDKTYKKGVEDAQLELINEYELDPEIDLKKWCRENKNQYTRARGKAWSTYLAHQGLVFDLRRPFCTTIHKAQGSEFDTIYLAQEDIKQSIRGGDYEQYARLMYVALSRAINKVVII